MVVFSKKSKNYFYSKVAKTFLIDQIKPNQFDGKVVDCVFNEYIRDRKDMSY